MKSPKIYEQFGSLICLMTGEFEHGKHKVFLRQLVRRDGKCVRWVIVHTKQKPDTHKYFLTHETVFKGIMQHHKGKYWIISWEDYKKLKLKLYSTDGIQHFTQYCKTQKNSFNILTRFPNYTNYRKWVSQTPNSSV